MRFAHWFKSRGRLRVVLGIFAIRISFEPCIRFVRDPIFCFFLYLESSFSCCAVPRIARRHFDAVNTAVALPQWFGLGDAAALVVDGLFETLGIGGADVIRGVSHPLLACSPS
jgi:hypothetical protein